MQNTRPECFGLAIFPEADSPVTTANFLASASRRDPLWDFSHNDAEGSIVTSDDGEESSEGIPEEGGKRKG